MDANLFIISVWSFVIVALCFIMFFILVYKFHLFEGREDVKQYIAISLNAMLVLVGTLVLMGLQTRANINQQKDNAVFNDKITVYQNFLQDFYCIIKDQKIDDTERYSLQIKLSYLSLHISDPEHTKEISRAVAAIITKIQNPYNEDKGIMIDLMEITDVMYEELYGKKLTTRNKTQTLSDLRDEMVLDFYGINVAPEDITAYYYVIGRIREIKALMENNLKNHKKPLLYDRQWVYNGYTLVHDLYTDKGSKNGEYVCNERTHKYAVDLVFSPKADSVRIEFFSRENTKESTKQILDTLEEMHFPLHDSIIQNNGHHIYRKWSTTSIDNETIANEISTLLQGLNKCRLKNANTVQSKSQTP